MTQYEEDLEYANKVLRIREALISGDLLKARGIQNFKMNKDCNEYTIQLGDGFNPVFSYLEEREDEGSTFIGSSRIIYAPHTKYFKVMYNPNTYEVSDDPIDEGWYFQRQLLLQDEVLKAAVIVKTLNSVPMAPYKYFSVHTEFIDEVLKRLDEVKL
jgi:hypothetical protein